MKFPNYPSAKTNQRSAFHQQRKALRIVRVVEAGQARSSVGRMLISGCIADICAELDRLAQRESAMA
ncbi:MAG: hypothetical protein K9J50_08180 [Sulfuritalea sp.]|jgi:hypothetical protein|nr:hypothetical protein [Sulfuritalea sp.]